MASLTRTLGRALCAVLLLAPSALAQAPPASVPLVPPSLDAGDRFGTSTDIDGDYAVVGVENFFTATDAGEAYVFVRQNGAWTYQATLTPSDGAAGDRFGEAVRISGDRIVVGAQDHSSPGALGGAAYVYKRTGTTWTEEAKLTLPGATSAADFGLAVGIHGLRIIVGAPSFLNSPSARAGAAYLFRWDGSAWIEDASFPGRFSPSQANGDSYGISVDITDDRILIGASGDNAVAFNGGAVYRFLRSGTTENWFPNGRLTPSLPVVNGFFGRAVALSFTGAAVGAPSSNAVYAYRRFGFNLTEEARLTPPASSSSISQFGLSVTMTDQRLGVGSIANGTGPHAFVYNTFDYSAPSASFASPDGVTDDSFGQSIALSGDGETAVIGAGLNDAAGTEAGAAYVVDANLSRQGGLYNPSSSQGNGANWRLLGVPSLSYDVSDLAALNLVQGLPAGAMNPAQYPGAAPNVYTGYDGLSFQPPADADVELAPGRGFFWFLFDRNLDASGIPSGTSNGYELTDFALRSPAPHPRTDVVTLIPTHTAPGADDFYMIANPFAAALPVSGISVVNGTIQGGNVFLAYNPAAPNPGYVIRSGTDVLSKWQGVLAEIVGNSPLRVLYDYAASVPGGQPPFVGRTDGDAPMSALRFELGGTLSGGGAAGDAAAMVRFRDDALSAWDAWDVSKPASPAAEQATLAPVLMRDGEPTRVAVDTRPADAAATLPLALRTTDGGTFTLSWTDTLPDGWTAWLTDAVTGETVDLRASADYAFTADGPTDAERFTLTVTPAGIVSGETEAPEAFELSAPSPNPVRARTRVQLAVGAPQTVRATLHDALGRTVAVLHDGDAAGTVTLAVDASGLATGVYTVRVQGAAGVATRRLTVVR